MASSRSFWCLRRGHPNQRKLSNHLGFGPNIEVRPGCWASCPDTCESDVGSRSQDVPRVCFKIQSMCARRYADRCVSSKVQYHGQEDIINIATSRRVRSNSERARADPDDVSLLGSVQPFTPIAFPRESHVFSLRSCENTLWSLRPSTSHSGTCVGLPACTR